MQVIQNNFITLQSQTLNPTIMEKINTLAIIAQNTTSKEVRTTLIPLVACNIDKDLHLFIESMAKISLSIKGKTEISVEELCSAMAEQTLIMATEIESAAEAYQQYLDTPVESRMDFLFESVIKAGLSMLENFLEEIA